MATITMTATRPGSNNGSTVQTYVEKKTYNVSDDLAYAFVKDGFATTKDRDLIDRVQLKNEASGESFALTADGEFGKVPFVPGDTDPDVKARLDAADALKAATNTFNVSPDAPPPVIVPVVDIPSATPVPAPENVPDNAVAVAPVVPTPGTEPPTATPPASTPPKRK